jgi:hypothetical protein
MTEILRPSEAIEQGLMIEGETEEDAARLARTALGCLAAAGYVQKHRSQLLYDDELVRLKVVEEMRSRQEWAWKPSESGG